MLKPLIIYSGYLQNIL